MATALRALKVEQLKEELQKREVVPSGNKTALIDLLYQHIIAEGNNVNNFLEEFYSKNENDDSDDDVVKNPTNENNGNVSQNINNNGTNGNESSNKIKRGDPHAIFIGNIPKSVKALDLKNLVNELSCVCVAKIVSLVVPELEDDKNWFGYLTLSNADDVAKVISELDDTCFFDSAIMVSNDLADLKKRMIELYCPAPKVVEKKTSEQATKNDITKITGAAKVAPKTTLNNNNNGDGSNSSSDIAKVKAAERRLRNEKNRLRQIKKRLEKDREQLEGERVALERTKIKNLPISKPLPRNRPLIASLALHSRPDRKIETMPTSLQITRKRSSPPIVRNDISERSISKERAIRRGKIEREIMERRKKQRLDESPPPTAILSASSQRRKSPPGRLPPRPRHEEERSRERFESRRERQPEVSRVRDSRLNVMSGSALGNFAPKSSPLVHDYNHGRSCLPIKRDSYGYSESDVRTDAHYSSRDFPSYNLGGGGQGYYYIDDNAMTAPRRRSDDYQVNRIPPRDNAMSASRIVYRR